MWQISANKQITAKIIWQNFELKWPTHQVLVSCLVQTSCFFFSAAYLELGRRGRSLSRDAQTSLSLLISSCSSSGTPGRQGDSSESWVLSGASSWWVKPWTPLQGRVQGEQRPWSELLHPLPKGTSSHLAPLVFTIWFGHYPKLVIRGKVRNEDRLVNWEPRRLQH